MNIFDSHHALEATSHWWSCNLPMHEVVYRVQCECPGIHAYQITAYSALLEVEFDAWCYGPRFTQMRCLDSKHQVSDDLLI